IVGEVWGIVRGGRGRKTRGGGGFSLGGKVGKGREVEDGYGEVCTYQYVRLFKVLEKIGAVAYKLEFPQELNKVHNTFHVSNLKKYHANEALAIPLDGLHIDNKLHVVEEPVLIWIVTLNDQNKAVS
nr:putative reverse transcriptase domain-containing protein [Tanacetum cinerariifolium]